MRVEQKVIDKLAELVTEADEVLSNARVVHARPNVIGLSGEYVDSQRTSRWGVSCLSILHKFFGQSSDYYKQFEAVYRNMERPSQVKEAKGIIEAAKRDYEQGFISSPRIMIQAEIFDDLLEQAKSLLDGGYSGPAAVLAGCVLEDGLRKLCDASSIQLSNKPKLDAMNSELAKAGVYSILIQKKITFLADIRNRAAHGRWTEFSEKDTESMIQEVRRFMEDYLS